MDDDFGERLIAWYKIHKRDLPWRNTKNAYKIWLSEVILQQTRVAQGLNYYYRFVEKYPDVFSLASAKQDDVFKLWQGLGYYNRAANLLEAAKIIVNKKISQPIFNSLTLVLKSKIVEYPVPRLIDRYLREQKIIN